MAGTCKTNVRIEFDSRTVIELKHDLCHVQDEFGNVATVTREEILRFVHTLVGHELDQLCGEDIGSMAVVETPPCEEDRCHDQL